MEEEGLEFFIADKVDCFKLRCLNSGCRYSRSLFANTMFFNSKKEPNQLLLFFQLWLARADHVTMAGMLKWTEKTVLQYCQVMRKLVAADMLRLMQNASVSYNCYGGIIGGPGVEVQIDESALENGSITLAVL